MNRTVTINEANQVALHAVYQDDQATNNEIQTPFQRHDYQSSLRLHYCATVLHYLFLYNKLRITAL